MLAEINNISDLFYCVFFYQILTKHGTSERTLTHTLLLLQLAGLPTELSKATRQMNSLLNLRKNCEYSVLTQPEGMFQQSVNEYSEIFDDSGTLMKMVNKTCQQAV